MKSVLKKQILGMTLIELMIASSILLVAVGITYAVWRTITQSFYVLESHVRSRQEVRIAANTIHDDVRNSVYLYAGRTATIEGVNYNVALIDSEGTDMLMAIPENANPGATTYTIVGYYLKPNNSDPVNPNAHDLMRYERNGVTPITADMPNTINLANVNGGKTVTVAHYMDPNYFSFKIRDNGNSIDIRPLARKQEISNQQSVITSIFTTINIKNK